MQAAHSLHALRVVAAHMLHAALLVLLCIRSRAGRLCRAHGCPMWLHMSRATLNVSCAHTAVP
eukprot:7752165-Alexandrium_andersonii.AAC.1